MRITGLSPLALRHEDLVRYGREGDLYVQRQYVAEVDDSALPMVLRLEVEVADGRAECVELTCRRRPGGPPVTGEQLRKLRLAKYVRASVGLYAVRWMAAGTDAELFQATGGDDEVLLERARARRALGDDHLRQVADVATAGGATPVVAVQRKWNVSRSQASRYMRAARQAGFLSETKPRTRKGKQ